MSPQELFTSNNQLTGLWRLQKMERIMADGEVCYPFSQDPIGYLFYSDRGFMFAILMSAKRARVGISLEELGRAKQQKRLWRWKYMKALFRYLQAATSCIAYFGTYEIKGDRVLHHVLASLFPDWMNTDLERGFVLSERVARLTAQYPNGERMELVWELL